MKRPNDQVEGLLLQYACTYGRCFSSHLPILYGSSAFSKGVLIPFYVLSFAFVGRQANEDGEISAEEKDGFFGIGANFIITEALKEKSGWRISSKAQRQHWAPLVDMMRVIDGTLPQIGTHMFAGNSYLNREAPLRREAQDIVDDVPMVMWSIQTKCLSAPQFVEPKGLTSVALENLFRFLACAKEGGALLSQTGLLAAVKHENRSS